MNEIFLAGIKPDDNKQKKTIELGNDENENKKVEPDNEETFKTESEESKSDNQEDETGEKRENDLEKYMRLKEELLEHEVSCDTTQALSSLNICGGEELISIYGVERFVDALKEINKKDKNGLVERNMYEVIKILEPDKEKRLKTYNIISEKIEKENDKVTAELDKHSYYPDDEYEYIPHNIIYAPVSCNISRKRLEFSVLKAVNGRKLSNIAAKVFSTITKKPISPFDKHFSRQSTLSETYNSFFHYNPEEVDLGEFKTDLENSDSKEGKIFGATMEKIERIEKEKEILTKEMNEFVNELNIKIDEINENINNKFLQNLQKLEEKYPNLKDELKNEIKQKRDEDYKSESEQKSHIEEVASKMFEDEFLKLAKEYQKETEEQTRKYYIMIKDMKFSWKSDVFSRVLAHNKEN